MPMVHVEYEYEVNTLADWKAKLPEDEYDDLIESLSQDIWLHDDGMLTYELMQDLLHETFGQKKMQTVDSCTCGACQSCGVGLEGWFRLFDVPADMFPKVIPILQEAADRGFDDPDWCGFTVKQERWGYRRTVELHSFWDWWEISEISKNDYADVEAWLERVEEFILEHLDDVANRIFKEAVADQDYQRSEEGIMDRWGDEDTFFSIGGKVSYL